MSKERAQRRAEREREAAVMAAARAAEAERRQRRDARLRAVTSQLPKRRPRPTGIIAERRRKQTGATIALLLALNVLVWVFLQDWGVSLAALVVSLLAAPVLYTLLFRRS
jgi:Flp pilus assembly protein TadB